MRKVVLGLMLAASAALYGCAGANFERPAETAIKVGKSTYSDVIDEMGDPRSSGEALIQDRRIKTITYVYSAAGQQPAESGVIPARALTYFFDKDLLVGAQFVSSFKDDSTNFDESKVQYIKRGETTRSQALLAFGRPSTVLLEPMVKKTNGEAIGYLYHATRGNVYTGFKNSRKVLILTFDESDKVMEIDFSTQGSN